MHTQVQEYYSKTLKTSQDLQTNACCTDVAIPPYIKKVLSTIHPEVHQKYYGCGLTIPPLLEGMRILDLGSGSGRDCFVLSKLVGESGSVVGVDMTEEQLSVARETEQYHAKQFGYKKPNTTFLHGYIEKLQDLDLQENSFDIIISNCVINLSPDKPAVFREAYRLLKPGGELYFSDVYSDRKIPEILKKDQNLYGECLSGALYWHDFLDLAKACGFKDPRLVEDKPITIDNAVLAAKVTPIQFFSATYRLFKLDDLESICEDYGQAVIYQGTIPHHNQLFTLDKHHHIEPGKVFPVCGNTYRMLHDTRLAPHFKFLGDWQTHYGPFKGCGTNLPFDTKQSSQQTSNCC